MGNSHEGFGKIQSLDIEKKENKYMWLEMKLTKYFKIFFSEFPSMLTWNRYMKYYVINVRSKHVLTVEDFMFKLKLRSIKPNLFSVPTQQDLLRKTPKKTQVLLMISQYNTDFMISAVIKTLLSHSWFFNRHMKKHANPQGKTHRL